MLIFRRFTNTLDRDIIRPNNSLNISRELMPQILEKDYQDFIGYLNHCGIKSKFTKRPVGLLKATQGELNISKAQSLINTKSSKLNMPLIVSKDDYLLDGHHRWLANMMISDKMPVNVILVDIKIQDLLALARRYRGVTYRKIK